jgi:putative Ca2+/H+ antiporter (TMEM165/GDT1 family)
MWVVAFGTILGHSICTLAAVLGGRYISTKISVKHGAYGPGRTFELLPLAVLAEANYCIVTLAGAVLFLLFGLGYGYEALSSFSSAGHDALDPPAGLPSRPDDPEALYRRW